MLRFPLVLISLFLLLPAIVGQDLQRVEANIQKLGTSFRLISYVDDSMRWSQVIAESHRILDLIDSTFSDYRSDSEAFVIVSSSGSGTWIPVSERMWFVLDYSLRMAERTNGAFDISIGPLSKLWRRAIRQQELPNEDSRLTALSKVDYRKILIDKTTQSVMLESPGMSLDFGGIAKGYAVDELYRILSQNGFSRSLVDGGGDIFAGDAPPGEKGWKIRVASTEDFIELRQQAIASSGSTYKYLVHEGLRYSHIVDPRTGFGITDPDIVNVIADSCMEADALASAASILGSKKSKHLIKRFPGSEIR